jgi:2-oxoisovalerate dehydrogenase E1 component
MREALEAVTGGLRSFLKGVASRSPLREAAAPLGSAPSLSVGQALELFEDQLRSRALDGAARALKATGQGYYTIGSAGHEQNAVLGALLRTTDPCLLHYRSGAFMMARSRKQAGTDAVRDTLLSLCAAAADPIAQGRHKVWGSRPLWVLPQTSTIASHLPRAVGMAFAIGRARRLGLPLPVPADAIVCCSFGDASLNHASALAALNAARYAQRTGNALPLLLVCEDNGLGISVATPRGWVEASVSSLPHLLYLRAEGGLESCWKICEQAIDACRSGRSPVFVHLPTIRLFGHAGSDIETEYRSPEEIAADERRDPLLENARLLVESAAATPAQLLAALERVDREVADACARVAGAPPLQSREALVAPLAPYDEARCRRAAIRSATLEERFRSFAGRLPERASAPARRTLASQINAALYDELSRRPELWVFGEDVGRKGGVYHVSAGLQAAFGANRVFDTLLDETTVLGLALGAGVLGLLPVAEIQYLAYIHNALDQIRGEACSLSFFSSGQFRNPLVVRVAAFAYQRGFGGHFHNDNAIGALRDIPGLILAAPARGDDAARMLRGALAVAEECGRVVVFLEPIALYHEKDLYQEGDAGWLTDYPPPGQALLPGEIGVYGGDACDLLLVSYANGLRMSLRCAKRLREQHRLAARVVDLRWLNPLPIDALLPHAAACGRVLIADECRASGGGVADALLATLLERGFRGALASVRSADSYVPLGAASRTVLLQEDQIETAALDLAQRPADRKLSAARPATLGT